ESAPRSGFIDKSCDPVILFCFYRPAGCYVNPCVKQPKVREVIRTAKLKLMYVIDMICMVVSVYVPEGTNYFFPDLSFRTDQEPTPVLEEVIVTDHRRALYKIVQNGID